VICDFGERAAHGKYIKKWVRRGQFNWQSKMLEKFNVEIDNKYIFTWVEDE